MKRALLAILTLLFALPCFGQATNWCDSGTASLSDPLNAAYYSFAAPTGDTTHVWTSDPMAKYQQKVANTVTADKGFKFCGFKGETVSAKVYYKNTTGAAKNLDFTISDLVQTVAPNTHISNSTDIIVYGVRYYLVKTVSEMENDSTAGNLTICPNTGLGTANCYIPNGLVPKVDPYTGQTTNEFPISVANGDTQELHYEVLIPASTPSGYYTGTITITEAGASLAVLPITLAVWNVTMPPTSSLNTSYGMDGLTSCLGYYGVFAGCGAAYPLASSDDNALMLGNLGMMYLMLDHRMSLANPPVWGVGSGGTVPHTPDLWTLFDNNYGPLLTGNSVHTRLSGAKLTRLSMGDQPASNADAAYWVAHFQANNWRQLYIYLFDEPGTIAGSWGTAATRATISDNPSPIIPGLITSNFYCANANYASSSPSPLQFLNFMVTTFGDLNAAGPGCSGGTQITYATYATWLAGGSGSFSVQCTLAGSPSCPQVWFYDACPDHNTCNNNQWGGGDGRGTASRDTGNDNYPSLMIDADAVRNAIHPIVAAVFPATGLLYYNVGECWNPAPSQACQDVNGSTGTDPWVYQYSFGGNGEGMLLLPGTHAKVGTGVLASWTPIPIATVQLKNQLFGMQMYEYIAALRSAGETAFVNTQLATFYTGPYTYTHCNVDGTGTGCAGQKDVIGCSPCMMSARNAMGEKLHELTLIPSGASAGIGGTMKTGGTIKIQ